MGLRVKTISFPTLRHFQVGSPNNTDRRLFQSALATPALSPHPSLPYPCPRHPNNSSIQLGSTSVKTKIREASRIGEHARKGKRGNFHTEPQLSAVLGIYRNLPLPKSVQDGGVDTSIDRIRFTLIHSPRVPPPCAFKYVIRVVNVTWSTLLFEKLTNNLTSYAYACMYRFSELRYMGIYRKTKGFILERI